MSILTRLRWQLFSENFNREYVLIRSKYEVKFVKMDVPPMAIFCLDNRTSLCGFADRLKGMVSCYAYAKAIGIPFRIEHIVPFDLSDYFVPNKYEWRVKSSEKSYNLLYANPIFWLNWLNPVLSINTRIFKSNTKRQHHFYTNTDFVNKVNVEYNKNYTFGELFSELFKPSLMLEKAINEQKSQIGGNYVSVSFRFMQLMGDFKDSWGDVLSEEDKVDLLEKSLIIVRQLYEQEQKTVLVTSDSQTFIDFVSKQDFVYVIPGTIGHIGYSQDDGVTEKMFIDFCMISQADHVYMAHSGKMYRSAFAKTAALSTNTPYTEISY